MCQPGHGKGTEHGGNRDENRKQIDIFKQTQFCAEDTGCHHWEAESNINVKGVAAAIADRCSKPVHSNNAACRYNNNCSKKPEAERKGRCLTRPHSMTCRLTKAKRKIAASTAKALSDARIAMARIQGHPYRPARKKKRYFVVASKAIHPVFV